MIKTAIFGNVGNSNRIKTFIEMQYNPAAKNAGGEEMQVVCIASSFEQLVLQMHSKTVDVLIIPKDNAIGQMSFPWFLTANGVLLDNVYYADRLEKMDSLSEDEILNFFTPYLDTKHLGYLEFHLADHCNLNCKACEHYSALVDGEVYTEYEKFEKDFYKFHEYIDDVGLIRILGGEPLLNKDINKYIKLTRKLYPYARVHVVTNGLKIMAMDDSFYQTMLDNYIEFHISFYPPMEDTMKKMEEFLKEKGVSYTLSPLNTEFGKKQLLEPQNDDDTILAFNKCNQKMCNNFYDGKVAACFLPFTTKYFNAYFNKHLPEDGAIDLYEPGLTTRDLKEQLLLPFERCRYCSSETEMIPWDVAHEPSILEDWIRS